MWVAVSVPLSDHNNSDFRIHRRQEGVTGRGSTPVVTDLQYVGVHVLVEDRALSFSLGHRR
ncbi:hypothetical protein SEF58_02330 [Neomoorella humiferrea]|uniref:hypothetical protein n=1 Tax=Neomoorella humiferrea TaxID=676965 RepID=UPI00346DD05B